MSNDPYGSIYAALQSEDSQEYRDLLDSGSCTPSSGATLVVCGPIVGKTTHDSARVLLEVSADVTLRCIARSVSDATESSSGSEVVVQKSFQALRPGVFVLENLQADTQYTFKFAAVASGHMPEGQDDIKSTTTTTNALRNAQWRVGSFKTMPENPGQMRVVMASCDYPGRQVNHNGVDMWSHLFDQCVRRDRGGFAQLHRPADLFLRNGDQVYTDQRAFFAFKMCKELYENEYESRLAQASGAQKDQLSRELHSRMVDLYQRSYRRTFNRNCVKVVMANIPILSIWDDHELRNDYGTFPEDSDRNSLSFRIGLAARECYWWYQRQLWDDLEGDGENKTNGQNNSHNENPNFGAQQTNFKPILSEGHMHRYGDIGIMFVDTRGSRSFHHNKFFSSNSGEEKVTTTQRENAHLLTSDGEYPYLSDYQVAAMRHALSDEKDAFFNGITHLIAVQSVPLVNLNRTASSCLGTCFGAQTDKMGFGYFPHDQRVYLDIMTAWKHRSQYHRTVLFVGGDMHYALNSYVFARQTPDGVARRGPTAGPRPMKMGYEEQQEGMVNALLTLPESARALLRKETEDPLFLGKQVVSSAISNRPPPCFVYYPINRCCGLCGWTCCCCCNTVGEGRYRFEHFDWAPQNNYSVVDVDVRWPFISSRVEFGTESGREHDGKVCCNARGAPCCKPCIPWCS